MIALDLLWWLGWAWMAAWMAVPLLALHPLGPVLGAVAWVVIVPWSALLGMALVHRLLPRSVPGTFRLPGDRGSLRWALGTWAPSVYLTLFQPVFFNSRGFQRIALRAFGARLGAGAWVTSRTVIREPQHLRLGAGSLIGEHAHLACSFQPRPGLLVVADITIGDDTLIGAYCHLAPGATVGSRCIVEHAAVIGAGSRIGDGARIGAGSALYNRVRIGADAVIGKNCVVPSGTVVPPGSRIPDGTVVGRGTTAPRSTGPRESPVSRPATVSREAP